MKLTTAGEPLDTAALKAGMSPNTARKYRTSQQLPSEIRSAREPRSWRTREDPFTSVWAELRELLLVNPGLQALTLFQELQRRYPGRFQDGQLRTLQRKVKAWRALEGPPKEVFFPQRHEPGELAASDFCHLSELQVTLAGQPFPHLFFHFVLTYSNWETGSICASESWESLAAGLQAALFALGGVPLRHRTDSLTAAVHVLEQPGTFTERYTALLAHYGLAGEHIQPAQPHENGDVEQRHYRFKTALDQALMLRGSRDFPDRATYQGFLQQLLDQLNAGRQERLRAELAVLRPLPPRKLELLRRLTVTVGPSSTIRVLHNTYSVPSRLIGEKVEVRIELEHLDVFYGQRPVLRLPRLRGEEQFRIDYRHVIDWLVRKPGAFAGYRYRADLFPTSRFRMAYDALRQQEPLQAERQYLQLLWLAARESEQGVEDALRQWLSREGPLCVAAVEEQVRQRQPVPPATTITVAPVDLQAYDLLLAQPEAAEAVR